MLVIDSFVVCKTFIVYIHELVVRARQLDSVAQLVRFDSCQGPIYSWTSMIWILALHLVELILEC
jgi:hypothetical protein